MVDINQKKFIIILYPFRNVQSLMKAYAIMQGSVYAYEKFSQLWKRWNLRVVMYERSMIMNWIPTHHETLGVQNICSLWPMQQSIQAGLDPLSIGGFLDLGLNGYNTKWFDSSMYHMIEDLPTDVKILLSHIVEFTFKKYVIRENL